MGAPPPARFHPVLCSLVRVCATALHQARVQCSPVRVQCSPVRLQCSASTMFLVMLMQEQQPEQPPGGPPQSTSRACVAPPGRLPPLS